MSAPTVEEVDRGPGWREFLDLPFLLGGTRPDALWLLTVQRRRLSSRRHPLFSSGGEAAYFLARRGGRPTARITAHVHERGGEGWFGFLVVEGPEDIDVVRSLLAAAGEWLAKRGCRTISGPMSFSADEEAGVLVAGHDEPLVTARAWTPQWYAPLLAGAGLTVREELESYRLPATGQPSRHLRPASVGIPAELQMFADPALMLRLPGGEVVVAVPDVGRAMAEGKVRTAWSLARKARQRAWDSCVVIALDGPEEVLIPGLCAAAGMAGYRWVLSPWGPVGSHPVWRHRLYIGDIAAVAAGRAPD